MLKSHSVPPDYVCLRVSVTGSGIRLFWAGVAQLVEHLICNQTVGGSNPFASSSSSAELKQWVSRVCRICFSARPRFAVQPSFSSNPEYARKCRWRVSETVGKRAVRGVHRWPSG